MCVSGRKIIKQPKTKKKKKNSRLLFSSIFPNILFALKAPDVFFYICIYEPPNHPTLFTTYSRNINTLLHTHTHAIRLLLFIPVEIHTRGSRQLAFVSVFGALVMCCFSPQSRLTHGIWQRQKIQKQKFSVFCSILFYIKKNSNNNKISKPNDKKVCLQFFSSKIAVLSRARYAVTTQTF